MYVFCMSDNFYLRELNFVDRWKNRKNRKNKTRKNFLPHGILREEEHLLLKISKHGIHSMYFLS